MAITLRCGAYKDFDPNKLLPAELAVVLEGDPRASNGRSLYACYKPGVVKQIATYEDMVQFLKASMSDTSEQIAEELARQFTENLLAATNAANNAAQAAATAIQNIANLKSQIQEEESKRASAETKRQQDSAKAIEEANEAAKAANDAAEAANTVAQEGRNYEGVLASFPETGMAGISYIDIETNTTYRWDKITETYIAIGSTGDLGVVSDEYASDKDYLVGDYFIKENTLYKVTKNKPAGEWDETAVAPTTVGVEFQALNAKIEPTLIWENDNPGKNFASTTINIDLSNYKRFSVIMAQNTSYPNRVIDFTCRKGQSFVCTDGWDCFVGKSRHNKNLCYCNNKSFGRYIKICLL